VPYKSDRQRRYFNWAAGEKGTGITKKMAKEYNKASKGMKLPETVKKKKRKTMAEQIIDVANSWLGEENVSEAIKADGTAVVVGQQKAKNPEVVQIEINKLKEDMKKDVLYIKAHDPKTSTNQRDALLIQWNKKVDEKIRQKYGIKKTVALEDDAGGVAPSSPAITTTSINAPDSSARFGSSVFASRWGTTQKRKVPKSESYIEDRLGKLF
jgi:hypothetical protein